MEKLQTIIFLFRHGLTDRRPSDEVNVDKGRMLSKEGRAQAKVVGEYLREFSPSAIFSSPYDRTKDTAEIIRESAAINAQVKTESALAEIYRHFHLNEREWEIERFINSLVEKFDGRAVVVVTHQVPIEEYLPRIGFTAAEIEAPCQMGQGYRITFADAKPVECQKLNPALV